MTGAPTNWAQRMRKASCGDGLRSQLLRGGIGSILTKIGGLSLSLMLATVLARVLGPENYGIYAYVFALISVLAIPAQFGLPALVVRETAKAQANQHWGLMRGVWRWATLAVGALSLMLVGVAAILAWLFAARFTPPQVATLAWGFLLIPILALGSLRAAALRGLRHVVRGQLPESILRPGLLLSAIGCIVLLSPDSTLTPAWAMALHGLAALLAFIAGAWMLWKVRPAGVQASPTAIYQSRKWLSAAFPLALIGGMQVLNQYIDILMLGYFESAKDVGIYRVSVQGSTIVSFGLSAIGMVTMPYFARFYEQGDMAAFQRVATVGARVMLAIALPIALFFLLFGESILSLVFGDEYQGAYYPLVILAMAHVVNSAFGTVGPLLNMAGYEKISARGITIAAVSNVALNLILIPRIGSIGAAISTSLTLVVWNVTLWCSVRRILNIDSSALGRF